MEYFLQDDDYLSSSSDENEEDMSPYRKAKSNPPPAQVISHSSINMPGHFSADRLHISLA